MSFFIAVLTLLVFVLVHRALSHNALRSEELQDKSAADHWALALWATAIMPTPALILLMLPINLGNKLGATAAGAVLVFTLWLWFVARNALSKRFRRSKERCGRLLYRLVIPTTLLGFLAFIAFRLMP